MKLQPISWCLPLDLTAESLDISVLAGRINLPAHSKGPWLCSKRVIDRGLEGGPQPSEQAGDGADPDLAGAAVKRSAGLDDGSAGEPRQNLMAKADAEDWHFTEEGCGQCHSAGGVLGTLRARREHQGQARVNQVT